MEPNKQPTDNPIPLLTSPCGPHLDPKACPRTLESVFREGGAPSLLGELADRRGGERWVFLTLCASHPPHPHSLTGTARELRRARKSRAAGGWAAGRESGAGDQVAVAGEESRLLGSCLDLVVPVSTGHNWVQMGAIAADGHGFSKQSVGRSLL
jgi:hypothetical protein